MLKLKTIRPNTLGVTQTVEYDTYSDAEPWIERQCERLADNGWILSELKGSTSKQGSIECTHDYEADVLIIQWTTE